jgi:hypothetical protein
MMPFACQAVRCAESDAEIHDVAIDEFVDLIDELERIFQAGHRGWRSRGQWEE